jgi:uncharacterized membrane protein YphA (DoxX/SURF4 family)
MRRRSDDDERVHEVPIEYERGPLERERAQIERERGTLERERAQIGRGTRERGMIEREHHGGAHTAFLIGRILLGGFFLLNALNHFANVNTMAGFAAAKGIPQASLAVIGAGILLLIAGVSFLLGWRPWVGVVAVALFLIPVTFFMHAFWTTADPIARQLDLVNFAKNVALLGASLMFLAIPQPWPWTVASLRARRRVRRMEPQPA